MTNVIFENTRIVGCNFNGTILEQVTFNGTGLRETTFNGTVLGNTRFENCVLSNVSFDNAHQIPIFNNFTNTRFYNTISFRNTQFSSERYNLTVAPVALIQGIHNISQVLMGPTTNAYLDFRDERGTSNLLWATNVVDRNNHNDTDIDTDIEPENENNENMAPHQPQRPPPVGIAFEIHSIADIAIKYYTFFLQENYNNETSPSSVEDIQRRFQNVIQTNESIEEVKTQKLSKLEAVMQRVGACEIEPSFFTLIKKAVHFALTSSPEFQAAYVDIYVDECFKAYSSSANGISCAKGLKERFLTSLGGAALQVKNIPGYRVSLQERKLALIGMLSQIKGLGDFFGAWAQSWSDDTNAESNAELLKQWKQMTPITRRDHFIDFSFEKLKRDLNIQQDLNIQDRELDSLFQSVGKDFRTLILKMLNDTTRNDHSYYEQIFNNNEEAASFGGGKRKTYRKTNRKRNRKTYTHQIKSKCRSKRTKTIKMKRR